jgi:hypothetical protein
MNVQDLLHEGVPEFTGLGQSYGTWRTFFRNKVLSYSHNIDDGVLGRWLRSRIGEKVALMVKDQMG